MDDQLLRLTKEYAVRMDKTFTAVIEDALREMLARQHLAGQRVPVQLTVVSGNGLQPGVDLDDSAALLDYMEEPVDSA